MSCSWVNHVSLETGISVEKPMLCGMTGAHGSITSPWLPLRQTWQAQELGFPWLSGSGSGVEAPPDPPGPEAPLV